MALRLKELRKKKWFSIVTNLYVIILTIFAIWMIFFDTNSLLIHTELKKEIKNLEKTKDFLINEIEKDKKTRDKLSDKSELEKFAREQYYLKKKNEEIYLIEYQDSIKTSKNE